MDDDEDLGDDDAFLDVDDDFDYDEYVRENHSSGSGTSLKPIWKATATALLLMIAVWFWMVIG